MKFDTGLDMEMYQECYIIALDEFKKSEYYLSNDKGNNKRTDVNAWLSLLLPARDIFRYFYHQEALL